MVYGGAFQRMDGFDLDFEALIARSHAADDFDSAVALVKTAFEQARQLIDGKSDEELMAALPDGPIMAGLPKLAVVSGIVDHTAHHRGALAVYYSFARQRAADAICA